MIDDMSFEQIHSALSGGKKAEGIKARSLEEALEIREDFRKNWRRYLGI